MSRTTDWVLTMQEDSLEMTVLEFIEKYGRENVHIWEYMREAYCNAVV